MTSMEQAAARAHADEGASPSRARESTQDTGPAAGGQNLLAGAHATRVGPAGVLALQRLAGNASVVQRLSEPTVQRDPKPNPPLAASLFTVAAPAPTVSGAVSARPSSKVPGAVEIVGPTIALQTTVTLAHPDDLEQGLSIGYVQTLMASRRQGVYGVKGREAMRRTTSTPQTRDVAPQVNASGQAVGAIKAGERAIPPDPFFSWPQTLGQSGASVTLSFVDIPSFTVESREGDAVLQGSDGTERFVLSVAAKDTSTGQVVHLGESIAWEFSWKQVIDSSGAGQGGQGITWSISPTGAPIMTDGRIAHSGGHSWWDFATLAAAQAVSTDRLLENAALTAKAGAASEPSRSHTLAALRARNPRFAVQVSSDDTAAWVGKDSVRVTVHGDQSVSRDTVVHEDAPNFIDFRLLDVFSDVAVIAAASTLTFTLEVTSEWTGSPGTVAFPLPFTTLRTGKPVSAHGGSYHLSGSF